MNSVLKHPIFQKITSITLYVAYFFVNFLTLTKFPLIHSDEVWLAKLSSAYLANKSIYTTEPFFDLFPRQAHTIKSLFHLSQGLMISLFGETIFSVRLLSLMASMVVVLLLHRIIYTKTKHHLVTLLIVMTLGLNSQFIYASHFGRQEILLLLVITLCLYLYTHESLKASYRYLLPGILIGISIGFHPNAFILSAMFFALLLSDFIKKKASLKHLITYILILAGFAGLYILTSFIGNPNFIEDYYTYGSTLSVNADAVGRLQNFMAFYEKLFHQISGTYYLPDICLHLLLPLLALIQVILCLVVPSKKSISIPTHAPVYKWYLMLLAYNTALFIIGRFNPTSILFHLLATTMILLELTSIWIQKSKLSTRVIILLLSLIVIANLYTLNDSYQQNKHHDFSNYNQELASAITEDSVILGNLSGGFAFNDNPFYDIRNLDYLDGMTVEAYLRSNDINTLIYYEAYDYIHRNPQWQILYGDDSGYYDELNDIIKTHGTLVHEFSDPYYGIRIIRYMGDYPWSIQIYTIDLDDD